MTAGQAGGGRGARAAGILSAGGSPEDPRGRPSSWRDLQEQGAVRSERPGGRPGGRRRPRAPRSRGPEAGNQGRRGESSAAAQAAWSLERWGPGAGEPGPRWAGRWEAPRRPGWGLFPEIEQEPWRVASKGRDRDRSGCQKDPSGPCGACTRGRDWWRLAGWGGGCLSGDPGDREEGLGQGMDGGWGG